MIPWLAKACMVAYCAVFGRHAAHLHLQRITRAARAAAELQEGIADCGDQEDAEDDDDEDGQLRRQRRRSKLLPDWGRIARAAWGSHDEL